MDAFISLIALASTTWLVGLLVRNQLRAWRLRRRFEHGRQGESKAVWLLRQYGYKVLDRQVHRRGTILCDGRPVTFDVYADFWVEKDGRELPADAKTGASGSIMDRNTRRQLLEYARLFGTDRVVLVAPDEGGVTEVSFDPGDGQQCLRRG